MNISFAISLAVMLAGLILYFVTTGPKVNEVARIMFAMGLLATLLRFAGEASLRIN